MWALGVVLFELLAPFGSAMERAVALETLRHDANAALADYELRECPRDAALVRAMTAPDPSARPTADTVLKALLDIIADSDKSPQEATSTSTSRVDNTML